MTTKRSCRMARSGRSTGYTLVELLIVLGIVALLAATAMPLAELSLQREKERELKRALWEIRDALDAYRRAREGAPSNGAAVLYPPDLRTLTLPLPDLRPGHQGELHVFLRRVPRDPFADPALPAEKTWGLRSYLSEAEQPKPGADVYDIYSLAPGVGLNGVLLRQW